MTSKSSKQNSINQKIRKTSSSKNINHVHNYPESALFTNKESEMKLLQQTNDSYSILCSFYNKKENNNSHFLEKISKFNNKFYICSEKYILAKTNLEKLNDDLYLNLFKQIDCYVEEIQRLNKKLSETDKSNDYQKIIKNLNKEILENKNAIRSLEIKLTKKNTNEEKLLKEIESYKRRIIFYKDKIKINLGMRQNNIINYTNINKNNYNQNNKKDLNDIKTQKTFEYKLKEYFSPSHQTRNYHVVKNNNTNLQPQYLNQTHHNFCLNPYNFKNRENGAKISSPFNEKNLYSDNETENNNNDNINDPIKINKNYKFKESIVVKNKVMSPPIFSRIHTRKLENIGEENRNNYDNANNENNYSPSRNSEKDENNDNNNNKNNLNNLCFTDNDEEDSIKPINKKTYRINNLKDTNTTQKKEKKNFLTENSSTRNKLNMKNSQKTMRTTKKFLPQKKCLDFTINKKNNTTLGDLSKMNKNKTTTNKDKISQFNVTSSKKFYDTNTEDFNINVNKIDIKKRMKKNVSTMGIISKNINKNKNNEIRKFNTNYGNDSMNNNVMNVTSSSQIISKPSYVTYRRQSEKKKINSKIDKEYYKILNEVNDDYNNNIEMLTRQEEQIKFMLSLLEN